MKLIGKILSFLWRCWFGVIAVASTLTFGLMLVYPFSFKDKHYKITAFFMRAWGASVFYLSGLWLRFKGERLDKNQQYIVVANHTSFMDIMLMLTVVKNPMIFVGKAELEKIPIFGRIYRRVAVTVDRKDRRSRSQVFKKVGERIEKGYSVCIFPEGGVPDDTSIVLDDFKRGPFVISNMYNLPMAVYTICGMKEHMPYGLFTGYPGQISVFCNAIIPANKYPKEKMEDYKNYVYNLMYNQLMQCNKKA